MILRKTLTVIEQWGQIPEPETSSRFRTCLGLQLALRRLLLGFGGTMPLVPDRFNS
jgi:hypothetical protein